MGSFTLIATSIVLQYSKQETGQTPLQLMKIDHVFAAGTILWAFSLFYIPHISQYLLAPDSNTRWWGRRR